MVNYITFKYATVKNIRIGGDATYEDFDTYTEVDEHGNITKTSTRATWVDMDLDATSYVYKDFGVNHFTNFEHDIEVMSHTSSDDGQVACWALANLVTEMDDINDNNRPAIMLIQFYTDTGYHYSLKNGETGDTDFNTLAKDTLYYCTISRVGTTAVCNFYNDFTRINLESTLTITCTAVQFRYLYACMSADEAQVDKETSGYSQNFNIKEVDADGCHIDLTPVGASSNWDCVDDPIVAPDEDITYVYNDATALKYDLYKLPDHITESGTIDYIKIYGRAKSHTYAQHPDGIFKLILTDNACSNIYKSNDIDLTTSYVTYDNEWLVNPRTTNEWTWDDFDNLQIGIECSSPTVGENEPEIRTTQCYAEIGYSTQCNMITPEEVSTNHIQNVKEMNMWNGERIVFGESRNKWSLLLKGQDWENDACDKILCLKQLGLAGLPIVLSGLNNTNWDTEWLIKSIGWKLILNKPLHYEWIILLEKT